MRFLDFWSGHADLARRWKDFNKVLYGDLVSVIVPVYNRADRIARSVGSLSAQSYRNLDIILVDDCSGDDLATAVAALQDPRIRLIRRDKNGGAAAARNTGVAAARSEWIAFHDSDDICVFDRIERQVRIAADLAPDHIGVYSASIFYTQVTEDEFPLADAFMKPDPAEKRRLSGNAFPDTVTRNFINVPTMLIRKSAFDAAGGFDERLRNNEDWDFTLRLTRQGKFAFIPEPLYLVVRQVPRLAASAHISVSDRFSARSFVGVIFKLRRAGIPDHDLRGHMLGAARNLMRCGRFRLARRFIRRAISLRPLNPTAWRLLAFSFMPGLYGWLRRHDNRPV
jgi:glycosyltransferase involved in cell wall biosynthesis